MLGGQKKKIFRSKKLSDAEEASKLIAQELYKKNLQLAHTNRTLSLLRNIDELVLEATTTLDTLAQGVAGVIVKNSSYSMSAIFIRQQQEKTAPYFLMGYSFVDTLPSKSLAEDLQRFRLQPTESFLDANEKSLVISFDEDVSAFFESETHLVNSMARITKSKSFCVVRLMARRETVGILLVGMTEKSHDVNDDEQQLLERLSESIGVAIDNKLLFEQNQKVLRKLKQSNEKLKALDEAKDEFISMASHQLRTPLTSVKGYLSMLAEGDAGELNDTQKKFIDQAFISSQRMVYLIADLLNVSRLKTGKFVIEPTEVYLPDVVESEIAQLYETVKSRGLTMTFDKPKTFPKMMLDETKIRQVIMNFTDNAIYYTPTGGKIVVKLAVTNGGAEFTVTDTGMGVPRSERQHLFTKFYRAGNARKARPDGTGLGLFMAKKVVVASGGSIIFSSTEGKGSVFGFRFTLKQG